MLTNNEKEWLEHRKPGNWCVIAGCTAWCDRTEGYSSTPYCNSKTCYMDDPEFYRDATKFEARVAALLATLFQYITMDSPYDHEQEIPCNDCPMEHRCTLDCKESILKYARLAAEEEIDNETA